MMESRPANIDEVALGAFFEDIGKFMQRAHANVRDMAPEVRAREDVLLPSGRGGHFSHKHVLWTDAFFHWMEQEGIGFPKGVNLGRVRDQAVFHHRPTGALTWLSAVADRLSAGMDRKERDKPEKAGSWDQFRRTPLRSIFDRVDLGLGRPSGDAVYDVCALAPGAMDPGAVDGEGSPRAYEKLWPQFCAAFKQLCGATGDNIALFHEGLLAISERFTWSIPSSTVDLPDVSLHDHNRTVAAFAACLYRHHEARGELDDEKAVRDPEREKFRILVGDLSGIQASLFRLASEGVKGVNRILRARSFVMGAITDAAALMCREEFGLPPYCLLQSAGGRFQLLLPEIEGIERRIRAIRERLDAWMADQYFGELVLNIAITPPLAGTAFLRAALPATLDRIALAAEEAKQRPLSTRAAECIIEIDYPADGVCRACGVRPAAETDPQDPSIKRCWACAREARHGRQLPKAKAVVIRRTERADKRADLLGRFVLDIETKAAPDSASAAVMREIVSAWRPRDADAEASFPIADRFMANYVPILEKGDGDNGRYADLSEEARAVQPGETKTFEHLAADAREWVDGGWIGRAMLAVVKADVDRLGFVFGYGLGEDNTVSRTAALSRMLDAFFTGELMALIRKEFPATYTVYAGGDDVLLIAPRHQGIGLALRLREAFGRFVHHNPNLTLSAGVELVGAHEPLNRAVHRAERRLEASKDAGRDRISVIGDRPIPWAGGRGSLAWALDEAEWLNARLRDGVLSTAFLYRMLAFDRDRRCAEDPERPAPAAAGWRARWGYHLARLRERMHSQHMDGDACEAVMVRLDALIGGNLFRGSPARQDLADPAAEPDPRIPITIALYRNR